MDVNIALETLERLLEGAIEQLLPAEDLTGDRAKAQQCGTRSASGRSRAPGP